VAVRGRERSVSPVDIKMLLLEESLVSWSSLWGSQICLVKNIHSRIQRVEVKLPASGALSSRTELVDSLCTALDARYAQIRQDPIHCHEVDASSTVEKAQVLKKDGAVGLRS
jgi:hypothetical protein